MSFQSEIVKWYLSNKRDLPWRDTTDPYVIWLSEIILQQTRVEQGKPYFLKFLENFPNVSAFASASEEQVLKLWQGLGYYSRGRNMLYTARYVVANYGGQFPTSYEQLIKLKGVGSYTAAAISSFSSNEQQAVVDGNVYRVLSRYFGIEEPINSNLGQKMFSELAKELIIDQEPAIYNQAIMEFGALQCKPKSPVCSECPVQLGCYAFKHKKIDQLPVKLKKVKVRKRWFNYFVGITGDEILTKQRMPGDVWQHLYDFPLIETEEEVSMTSNEFLTQVEKLFGKDLELKVLEGKKHILTHQIIYVQFFAIDNYIVNFNQHAEIKSVKIEAFKQLPHPKIIGDFIEKHID
ncbi:A/G-specific adenine glycosylase [Pedobacter xixiisoli]|uniref:Adenine DNA glycosylase n=1 Tax=Pedobacter xixiisoli TaxID=1476464 RepID=A0A286ADB0_9SPHI|nr:A/G-specific adenine glycosylase [Pedobacter xixiisoli]SOD19896.1 A/G-specific DNA-adenine glycosylase [Pedobacter xixiisoli]